MLPTLSRLSVSYSPVSRLRHWCSSQSLRISPLHWEFHLPLLHSSYAVSKAIPTLKAGLSLQTYLAAYTPFTPNHSGQRLPPTYYRGCWHVVSRGFLLGYRLLLFTEDRSLRSEDLLPSRGVAGSGFPPLPNIPTAASRRSFGPSLSSNVADHPLRSATDRRLGGPSPHQLANRTRAHPSPDSSFDP